MEPSRSVYNRALRQIRVYLEEELRDPISNKNSVRKFAQLKYGIVLLKRDSYKWLVKISREGDLLGWPVTTKKTKAWNSRRRAKKKNKLPGRYESFLLTPYWKAVRKLVLARDGGICTKCGSNKNLHIHHITYANHFNELEHLEDLITLCRKCHKRVHGK